MNPVTGKPSREPKVTVTFAEDPDRELQLLRWLIDTARARREQRQENRESSRPEAA